VGESAGEQGFCAGAIETIKQAQDAMLTVRARAARINKWGFDGDSLRVVMAALNIHDEQISRATKGQITDALREIHRRIERGDVFTLEATTQ
jgi:chitinase